MTNKMDLEKLLIRNKPVKCKLCGGKMFYSSGGRYRCQECSYEELDDFGKVKNYLEENGIAPAVVVSRATGVEQEIIDLFLKKGRIEIPEGSNYYLKCEKCGCSIRYGRYCPQCVKSMAGGIKGAFLEEMGERPKYELNPEMQGKMHFLNQRKK